MTRRTGSGIGCFIVLPVILIGGCITTDLILLRSARPPANMKTIEDFQAWKGDAIMGKGTYENAGTNYTVMLAPAGRSLPSGPSAYLFDQNGQFIDWTGDIGDLKTVTYEFDLRSGGVKNFERRDR